MTEVKPITNKAERKAAEARLDEVFHSHPDTPEGRESRALAQALHDYERRHDFWQTPLDAVDRIEFMLDQGQADLPGLLEIFGGREPFLEFMLRKQPLDEATIDAILARFDTKREWLEVPFCEPPGWASLMDGEWLRAELDAMERELVVEMESEPVLASESEKEPELAVAAGG